MFELLTKKLTEFQLNDHRTPGLERIEPSLRLLTPICLLLLTSRSQLKEFAEHANAAQISDFCLMFTRLPRRSDADLMGLDEARTVINNWITAILNLGNYS